MGLSNTSTRSLTLIRHAKAAQDSGMLPDDLRPLNARGEQDASALAEWLRAQHFAPDHMLCSPARRTRQTLDALQLSAPVEFPDTLYLASAPQLLKMIQVLPENVRHVAVIGHNPGLHMLATQLVGHYAHAADEDRLMLKFPTSAVAMIQFATTSWRDIAPGSGTLLNLHY